MNVSRMLALLLTLTFCVVMGGARAGDMPDYDIHYQNRLTAQLLMDLFFQKIDRGELHVFEQAITRDMITPTQLAYVYQLDSEDAIISIFCILNIKIPVPTMPALYVSGISIHLDQHGNILNIKSHVRNE